MLATRPHVRPLLVALQRCPAYRVALVDRLHAWIFSVAGNRIGMVAQPTAQGVRSSGFGGWYGLDSHRVNERIIQLARHHYLDTAAILGQTMPGSGRPACRWRARGDYPAVPRRSLPASVRDRYAGSFVADPRTMTPARVRDLADPVIEHWVNTREQRLVEQILQERPDGLTHRLMRASRRSTSTPSSSCWSPWEN